MQTVAKDVYSGTATIGRVTAIIGIIFGTIFGIIGIMIAFFLRSVLKKYSESTTGTISCSNGNFMCNVQYTVNGKQYTSPASSGVNGQTVNVNYDPNNPNDVSIGVQSYLGFWIILVISLLLLVGPWINWYFVNKYKPYAALEGVKAII